MAPSLFAMMVFGAMVVTLRLVWMVRVADLPTYGHSVFAPDDKVSPLTHSLGRLSRPTGPEEIDLVRSRLAQAGFASASALPVYLAARSLFALVPPLVVLAVAPPRALAPGLTALLGASVIGYFLPSAVLALLRSERHRRIRRILPDALDMLVSSLEAGLGLDAALQYVSKELHVAGPDFSHELNVLNAELRAGIPRAEALARMDARIGMDEVTSLTGALTQAERYGAGVANSLRAHAHMSRRSRIIDAERRAAEAGPRLTVSMILFILPPLFAVLIGPTVVQVVTELIPAWEAR